jgi:hypothetical protein
LELIQRGVLIIFDEFQLIKNRSTAQHKACRTLTSTVINAGGRSRIMMLSGTAVETSEQVINIMYLLGIMKHRNISVFKKETLDFKLYAGRELRDVCLNYDPETTSHILEEEPFSPTNGKAVCYRLFIEVVKPHISFAMPPPELFTGVKLDCANEYYNINEEDGHMLENAIRSLNTATRYNKRTNDVDLGSRPNWKSITNALRNIEIAKIKTFIRSARHILETEPRSKVAVFCSYLIPINAIIEDLSKDYGVVKLTGAIKKEKRPERIRAFQEDNDKIRVIVANITVASQGISLDDTIGTRPRYAFLTPTYKIQHQQQAPYRFYRATTASTATVRVVYCKCMENLHVTETSIILALARKSKVMKDILTTQVKHGVIFPGDYKSIYEGDPNHIEVTEKITTVTSITKSSKVAITSIPRNIISVKGSSGRGQRNIVIKQTLV